MAVHCKAKETVLYERETCTGGASDLYSWRKALGQYMFSQNAARTTDTHHHHTDNLDVPILCELETPPLYPIAHAKTIGNTFPFQNPRRQQKRNIFPIVARGR